MRVVADLLRRGLIDARAVVHDGLEIHPAGRSGTTWAVLIPASAGPSLLVKEAGPTTPATTQRLADEARTLGRLQAEHSLVDVLPPVRAWDAVAHLLVLERWPAAETLRQYVARTGQPDERHAASLGQALARLHALPVRGDDAWPVAEPPWVLALHEPTVAWYRMSSAANLALLHLLQSFPSLGAELDRLRAEWQPVALIHGDLKLDNIIVRAEHGDTDTGIWLVDWESAALGDPAWDAGAVLGEYLLIWLRSIPAGLPNGHEHAGVPLDAVQPAIRAFWQGYDTAGAVTPAFTDRAIRYAGAWLLHQAYERLQEATALSVADVRQIQLSLNVLQHPADAAVTMFGFSGAASSGVMPVLDPS